MKIFYFNKPKSSIPYGLTGVEVHPSDVKAELKKVLEENEGKEYAEVCVYDSVLSDDSCYFQYFQKYLNLVVFKVIIVDPKKVYPLPNALDLNVFLGVSQKNVMRMASEFKNENKNCKVHLIDEFRYVAITHGDRPNKQ